MRGLSFYIIVLYCIYSWQLCNTLCSLHSFALHKNKPPDGNRGEQLKTLAIVVASSERTF